MERRGVLAALLGALSALEPIAGEGSKRGEHRKKEKRQQRIHRNQTLRQLADLAIAQCLVANPRVPAIDRDVHAACCQYAGQWDERRRTFDAIEGAAAFCACLDANAYCERCATSTAPIRPCPA